ncbi:MAG: oligosaccharide flippase family protein [Lewinellaceae bacterium]|nr:oligosaccharide flippase family protein [Lewinellaceae bacterium]
MLKGIISAGFSQKNLFEAVYTVCGRIVSIFLVIATTKFLTTFLSEASYGQLALYNITSTLPSMFFFGPLGQGILRFYPIARENGEISAFHQQYNRLFRYGAIVLLIVGAVSSVVCWRLGWKEWSLACLLIAALNASTSFNTFRYGLQNAARKRTLAMGLETGERVFQQVLAILLLWLVSGDPLIVMAGYLIASLVFMALNHTYYRRSFPETEKSSGEKIRTHYTTDILQYSWPFILFGVFTWIQSASERWTLEWMQSTETVGQYAVLNQIGFQSLSMLLGSISYFLFPILFQRAGNLKESHQFKQANQLNNIYLWFNVLLAAVLFLVFWAFGPEVIALLSDDKYVKVSGLLPLMVIAGGLFNFGQNYSNRFLLSMQTRLLLFPKITAAVAGCVLNIFAIRYYGLEGLVFALICTQCIYVLSLMVCWKYLGAHTCSN